MGRFPTILIGHLLDAALGHPANLLILLALPSGIEPLSPP
jgi:hypothetical protein